MAYSISAVSGATGYNWSVPAGATVASGQSTPSITVDWGTASSGLVTVTPTNSCFSGGANNLSVTVNTGASVSSSPTNLTVCAGSTASFSAAASGSPAPTVQWQVSTDGGSTWTNIGGATATTYSFTAGLPDTGSQYQAVFSNSCGTATTTAATLTVQPGVVGVSPSNWDFGAVATGASVSISFTVTNTGCGQLSGTATSPVPFAVVSGSPFTLPGFGATNLQVSFTPATVGFFTNDLIVTSDGGVATNQVTGAGALEVLAQFSASPSNGLAPLQVVFTDTSTGTITNRSWDFGDGTTTNTTGTVLTNTYAAGIYTVTLVVSGPLGAGTNSQTNAVVVTAYPPGDVNGDTHVTSADSLLINQVLVGLRSSNSVVFATAGYANGDVNQNGTVSAADSLLINQVIVGLRAYVVTKIVPSVRTNTVPTAVTIYGFGFPTNTVSGVTLGPPINLTLSNVVVLSKERITALVPAGGGIGTGTVSVAASPSNGVTSFGHFINQ